MDRYDGATASAAPDALPAAVAAGHFTSGVPGVKPRTVLEGWYMDGLVEEIRNAIIAGGITPNRAVYTQLRDAIQALISSAAVPFASYSDVQAGTSSSKAVTPASLTGGVSLTGNGYYKFPGGFILQWAYVNGPFGEGVQAFSFPVTFPNACLCLIPQAVNSAESTFEDSWPQWDRANTTASTGKVYTQASSSDNEDGFAYISLGY